MGLQIKCGVKGISFRVQGSNQNQLEKLKDEVISRHNDEGVVGNYFKKEQQRNQPCFSFP